MRKYANLFILGLLVIVFTASCSGDQPKAIELSDDSNTRAAQAETISATFAGQAVTIDAADIVAAAQMNADNQDAQDVMNINQALLGADKEAQLLDVKFTMADEPVENGMFIFGIETAEAKNLKVEMFDEEGFGMVANNQFDVTEGNNYKALNVKTLDNGTYTFRLKDDLGKELSREVVIASEE